MNNNLFKLTPDQIKQIIDSLDDTAGYLVEESTLVYLIEKYVNLDRNNNSSDSMLPLPTEPINQPAPEPVQDVALDLSQYDDYIQLWTDGSCSKNGSPDAIGGYGVVMVYKGKEKEIGGFKDDATSPEMELIAVIKGLESVLNRNLPAVVFSDSAYVVDGFNEKWFDRWQQNGWKNADNNPVANKSLWETALAFYRIYEVGDVKLEFVHVPAHAGLKYNEKADAIAKKWVEFRKKNKTRI